MKLAQILKNCSYQKVHGDMDLEVRGMHYDSRQIGAGDAFFALRGVVNDGHDFIASAIAGGAGQIDPPVAVASPAISGVGGGHDRRGRYGDDAPDSVDLPGCLARERRDVSEPARLEVTKRS